MSDEQRIVELRMRLESTRQELADALNDAQKKQLLELAEQLAAAQAVIAEVREFASNAAYRGDDDVVDGNEVVRIVSQSPAGALAAHDREVAAKTLREFADTIEPITTCPTDVRMARARAAALVSEPSTPEPCKCHRNFAYVAPTHPGHCCFLPAGQDCHQQEVAAWEAKRDACGPSIPGTPEQTEGEKS